MRRRLLPLLSLALISGACSEGGDDGGARDGGVSRTRDGGAEEDLAIPLVRGESVAATIGPTGGRVALEGERLAIDVPPGALAEETEIRISVIGDPADLLFELEPHGLTFAAPVTVTRVRDLPEATEGDYLQSRAARTPMILGADGVWEAPTDAETIDDEAAGTQTTQWSMTHFSLVLDSQPFGSTSVSAEIEMPTGDGYGDVNDDRGLSPEEYCVGQEFVPFISYAINDASYPIRLPDTPFFDSFDERAEYTATSVRIVSYRVATDAPVSGEIPRVTVDELTGTLVDEEDRLSIMPTFRCDAPGEGNWSVVLDLQIDAELTATLYPRSYNAQRERWEYVQLTDERAPETLILPATVRKHYGNLGRVICKPCGADELVEGTFVAPEMAEGVSVVAGAFGLPPDTPAAITAGNGVIVSDLTDGSTVHSQVPMPPDTVTTFRADSVRSQANDGTETELLVTAGADGLAYASYDRDNDRFGFWRLCIGCRPATDFDPIQDTMDRRRTTRLLVSARDVDVWESDGFGSFEDSGVPLVSATDLVAAQIAGQLVSLHPSADGTRFIGVTDEEIFYFDGTELTSVAKLGPGLRLIHCDGTVCAVSNFLGNAVYFLEWDGVLPPMLTGHSVAAAGPVGVHVGVEGGVPRVTFTGTMDHTVHITTLASDGTPTDDVRAVDPDCLNPGHAVEVRGRNRVAFTCNGNGRAGALAIE